MIKPVRYRIKLTLFEEFIIFPSPLYVIKLCCPFKKKEKIIIARKLWSSSSLLKTEEYPDYSNIQDKKIKHHGVY